jgi:hypothetical protein
MPRSTTGGAAAAWAGLGRTGPRACRSLHHRISDGKGIEERFVGPLARAVSHLPSGRIRWRAEARGHAGKAQMVQDPPDNCGALDDGDDPHGLTAARMLSRVEEEDLPLSEVGSEDLGKESIAHDPGELQAPAVKEGLKRGSAATKEVHGEAPIREDRLLPHSRRYAPRTATIRVCCAIVASLSVPLAQPTTSRSRPKCEVMFSTPVGVTMTLSSKW